jgi:hypothetical protein
VSQARHAVVTEHFVRIDTAAKVEEINATYSAATLSPLCITAQRRQAFLTRIVIWISELLVLGKWVQGWDVFGQSTAIT